MGENKEGAIEKIAVDFGDIFVRKTPDGKAFLRPIKAEMMLWERAGHLYGVRRGKETSVQITAEGYRHINKVASISIMTPPFVVVEGRQRSNPFIERDPTTRLITAVWIRRLGLGYSPIGNVVAIDKTLYYNVMSYFIQGIQAGMSKEKWETVDGQRQKSGESENPNMARLGVSGEIPEPIKGIPTKWVFFPTVPPVGIYLNLLDSAAVKCLDDHTQRQRFGDRIAQSIVDRLILRDHPAIGIATVEKPIREGDKWRGTVTVWGFRSDMGISEIKGRIEEATATTQPGDLQAKVVPIEEEEIEVEAVKADAKVVDIEPEAEEEKTAPANERTDLFTTPPATPPRPDPHAAKPDVEQFFLDRKRKREKEAAK